MKRGLLVTGCGRSGTAFMAKVFEEAGVPSRHEVCFNPLRQEWPSDWHGVESSWMAAPFIQDVPSHVHVVHQVRHPLAVIRSFMGFDFFRPDLRNHYVDFCYRHAPKIQEWKDPLDQCIQYWLSWNDMIEHSDVPRHRLEDVSASQLASTAEAAGIGVPEKLLQMAVQEWTGFNHRSHTPPRLSVTAQTLLDRPLGSKLRKTARRYGYTL